MNDKLKNYLPVLEIKNVIIEFGDWICEEFNFTLNEGEFFILNKSSGSGKSSLLRAILGFIKNKEGEIICFGKKVNEENIYEIRKQISWLPQNLDVMKAPLHDKTTLGFINNILNISDVVLDIRKVKEYFFELGLNENLLNSEFLSLSLGERQRVGLSLCALREKALWLLDEPTSSLDDKNTELAIAFIKKYSPTSLIISHRDLHIKGGKDE